MTSSLFDQLRKAGLADKKSLDKIRTEKHQQVKQQHQQKKKKSIGALETEALAFTSASKIAELAQREKQQRDQQLNAARKAAAEQKSLGAQIKQLIETHKQIKIPPSNKKEQTSEEPLNYNFLDNGKVKKILVGSKVQQQLTKGQLTIVKLGESYELVPNVVAEKILSRDVNYTVIRNETTETDKDDDPYKDYKIPDDLMW